LAPRPTLLTHFASVEEAQNLEPDAILRLAALAVEVREDAEHLRDRLRLSNEETARLVRAESHRPTFESATSEATARSHLYAEGTSAYRDRVLLAWARSGDGPADAAWRNHLTLPERWQVPRFPFGGEDVMALGVPAGPRVGALLRAVETWWIAGNFAADEAALRAKLGELARAWA
jgi:poly(A) polymerase